MSKGVTHTKASLTLSVGFLTFGLFTLDISGVLYSIGSLIGVFITPDIDVDNGFTADKYIRNKIGKWAEIIWNSSWYFYRKSFKHGGELSHFPVISTLGRIIYLYFLFIVIPHFIYYFVFHPAWDLWFVLNWYRDRIVENYKIIMGLASADFVHWGLDILTVEHKKENKHKEIIKENDK